MIYRKKRIHFNSRPHGGRHQNCSSNRLSIHFNSRPHGGRRSMQVLNTATQTFQLTPSRRATMAASIKKIRPGNFNLFQLTPSRRATCAASESYFGVIFQLTPSRRATFQTIIHPLHLLFQLTPSRRATLCTSSSVM